MFRKLDSYRQQCAESGRTDHVYIHGRPEEGGPLAVPRAASGEATCSAIPQARDRACSSITNQRSDR
jgi:hypothetical protein